VHGIQFHYETHGQGEPLVLIRGLGSNLDHWYPQVPDYSRHFQTVIFDNRGIGRSGISDGEFTIADMARDTVGLMDALGIARAHVMGLSMGGMIAQEVALRYPERVQGLVLACTHCGRGHSIPASDDILKLFAEYIQTGSLVAAVKAHRCLFSERTLKHAPEILERYARVSARFPASPAIMKRQYLAVQGHDTWERLPGVQAPTLAITGADDALIRPENSRILAERIPGARLAIIEGGGHQFLIECAEATNSAVLDFLKGLAG
jgi:pimeloyl-ACP methyl ester carboxylesterase